MHYPITIYEMSSNTHVIQILQGHPCIGSEANPLTTQQSLQLKLLFDICRRGMTGFCSLRYFPFSSCFLTIYGS